MESTEDTCVYIDGSCINNGKINAKAGYGVFFDYNDSRNEYGNIEGKQSNNTGELTALIRALEILKTENEVAIEKLSYVSKLQPSEVSSLLLELEFKGMIKTLPGKRYMLV